MTVFGSCGCGVIECIPPCPQEVIHFLLHGQSLAVGVKGQPAISLTQPYSNVAFDKGPRAIPDQIRDLKPLVEDNTEAPDGQTDAGETACSGCANYFTQLGGTQIVLASCAGHSGWRIDQLNKGTEWYNTYVIGQVTLGHDLVEWYGNNYECPAMGWIQGASDQLAGTTKSQYKTLLVGLQSDFDTDVKAISGQATTVKLLTGQTAYYARLSNNIPLAQYEAARDNANIIMVGPQYQFDTVDGTHLPNIAYKHFGYLFGRALYEVVTNGTWIPTQPTSVSAVGKVITIAFNVPSSPLVFDTVELPLATDYGFSVKDDTRTNTITDIQIIDSTNVQITVQYDLAANPKVRYGLDYLGSGLNITGGASGNLRDSDTGTWSYGGSTYNLYNWSVAFEEVIP